MADYYDVEEKKDGSYKVTPRNNSGCLSTVVGVIFLILIVFFIVRCSSDGSSSNSGNDQANGTQNTLPTTMPSEINLAYLHKIDQDTNVTDRIREGVTENFYGEKFNGPYFRLVSIFSMFTGWQESFVELATGEAYNTLTGTFFAEAEYDSYEVVFRVYTDGNLIYESTPITRRTEPIDFSVSISGAKTVKVVAVTKNSSTTELIRLYLVNAIVHK